MAIRRRSANMPDVMLTIFDCDGVLVDSELIALSELSVIMGELGRPMSVKACQDAFMGLHAADIVRGIEQRVERRLPELGGDMRARMLQRFHNELRPVPGIADALAQMNGPRCVASSSDRNRIELTLTLTGLRPFFGEHLFSGTEVKHGKPAPDIFIHAASVMGAAPSDCIVVEDSVMGVRAGRAAGMAVIGFVGASHAEPAHAEALKANGAFCVLTHMSELPAVVSDAEARALGATMVDV